VRVTGKPEISRTGATARTWIKPSAQVIYVILPGWAIESDPPLPLEADLKNTTVGADQPSGFGTGKCDCPVAVHSG